MGIDVALARSQANRINNSVSSLRNVKNNLTNYKANLNRLWQAEEMVYINSVIDNLSREISQLSSLLESLEDDIVAAAYDIRREEEAAAAAAAAAAKLKK